MLIEINSNNRLSSSKKVDSGALFGVGIDSIDIEDPYDWEASTPDEKILGNSFLKKSFTLLSILNLKFILIEKNFLINLYKNINCIKPAIETP